MNAQEKKRGTEWENRNEKKSNQDKFGMGLVA